MDDINPKMELARKRCYYRLGINHNMASRYVLRAYAADFTNQNMVKKYATHALKIVIGVFNGH